MKKEQQAKIIISDMNDNINNIINFDENPSSLKFSAAFLQKAMGIRANIARKTLGQNLKDFSDNCETESGMMGRYERGTTEINESCILKISVNCIERSNYYIDPKWIMTGSHLCPHFLKNDSLKIKNFDQNVKELKAMIETNNNSEIIEIDLNNYNQDFYGHCVFFTKKINIHDKNNLLDLNYMDCYLKLKNEDAKICKVSYDLESNCFIANKNINNNFQPFQIEINQIEKINLIQGFYRK